MLSASKSYKRQLSSLWWSKMSSSSLTEKNSQTLPSYREYRAKKRKAKKRKRAHRRSKNDSLDSSAPRHQVSFTIDLGKLRFEFMNIVNNEKNDISLKTIHNILNILIAYSNGEYDEEDSVRADDSSDSSEDEAEVSSLNILRQLDERIRLATDTQLSAEKLNAEERASVSYIFANYCLRYLYKDGKKTCEIIHILARDVNADAFNLWNFMDSTDRPSKPKKLPPVPGIEIHQRTETT